MRRSGFTIIEIMVVVGVIGLLAAIAIPNFMKHREKAQLNGCIENLSQVKGAKEVWSTDNNKTTGDAIAISEINAYLDGKTTPECPAGGTYAYEIVGSNPTCTVTGHTL